MQEDEARCSPHNLVEVVIEVPAGPCTECDAPSSLLETSEAIIEQPQDVNVAANPRRCSRPSASGKSYAPRNKRQRRGRPPAPASEMTHVESAAGTDQAYSHQPSTGIKLLLLSPPSLTREDSTDRLTGSETPLRTRRGTIRSWQRRPRPRSPSVVEGTPSVLEGTPEPFPDEVLPEESPVGLQYALGYDQEEPAAGGPIAIAPKMGSGLIPHTAVHPFPNALEKIRYVDGETDPVQQMPTSPFLLRHDTGSQSISSSPGATIDGHPGSSAILQGSPLQETEDPEGSGETQKTRPSDPEDDEDILLLGATFVECEEIIWPESKPDISLPLSAPDVPQEWSDTPGTMTFKTVKGEKQEMATFTAPFRCSKIIDLTGDDICGDDEHDELDEW